jgi:hypothetical protein
MNEFSERLLTNATRKKATRLGFGSLIVIPLVAILFQVYVPRFVPALSYLE